MLMVIVFLSPQQTPVQWWLIPSNSVREGDSETPVWQTYLLGCINGYFSAITLLLAGGLSALQTVTIASALPFAIVLLASIYGLIKALRVDVYKRDSQQMTTIAPPASRNPIPWQRPIKKYCLFFLNVHTCKTFYGRSR